MEKRKGDDVDGDDECLGAISSLYAASDVAACECHLNEKSVVECTGLVLMMSRRSPNGSSWWS